MLFFQLPQTIKCIENRGPLVARSTLSGEHLIESRSDDYVFVPLNLRFREMLALGARRLPAGRSTCVRSRTYIDVANAYGEGRLL
jgi:hypothetical protein